MSPSRSQPKTIPSEPIHDERGDRILAVGLYNRVGPLVGLPLALAGIAMSLFFIITRKDSISQTLPLIDLLILATSLYALYYCLRELLLLRKRALTLTTTRLYGHDGRSVFDYPLNDIRSVTEETKKSQMSGVQTFIVVKATQGRSVRLEQLKDLAILQRAIREAREQARQNLPPAAPQA